MNMLLTGTGSWCYATLNVVDIVTSIEYRKSNSPASRRTGGSHGAIVIHLQGRSFCFHCTMIYFVVNKSLVNTVQCAPWYLPLLCRLFRAAGEQTSLFITASMRCTGHS